MVTVSMPVSGSGVGILCGFSSNYEATPTVVSFKKYSHMHFRDEAIGPDFKFLGPLMLVRFATVRPFTGIIFCMSGLCCEDIAVILVIVRLGFTAFPSLEGAIESRSSSARTTSSCNI